MSSVESNRNIETKVHKAKCTDKPDRYQKSSQNPPTTSSGLSSPHKRVQQAENAFLHCGCTDHFCIGYEVRMLAQAATNTIKICGVTVHNFEECLADRGTRRPTEGSLIPHRMPKACNSELPGNLKMDHRQNGPPPQAR